jgi:Ca2+:H+ antiporter
MSAVNLTSLLSRWTVWAPLVAVVALVLSWGRDLPLFAVVLVALCLAGAVLAAVHHAEVVAHRVGEPFGSLVLAVAVTVIEVALIVTIMVDGGPESASLARDTVFAAVMITCNGIVGLSLLVAALRNHVAVFNAEGSGAALATVATLATLSLVLPTFTTSRPGPEFSAVQLTFAAVASLALYGLFVAMQTLRHREHFISVTHGAEAEHRTGAEAEHRTGAEAEHRTGAEAEHRTGGQAEHRTGDAEHPGTPDRPTALLSLVLLVVALVAVVGDAKAVSPTIESGVATAGLPHAVVGVVIALLVLLPETLAAVRAARQNRVQTSLNLALGSAMAGIGLTIPVIAPATIWLAGRCCSASAPPTWCCSRSPSSSPR